MFKNREAAVGLDAYSFVAGGVGVYVDGGEDVVGLFVGVEEVVCDFEAVDEEGCAALAVGVRE